MIIPIFATQFHFGGPDVLILLLILLIGGFPTWMVIDCINNEPSAGINKIVWILVIVFAPLGSLIYFFARKLRRSPQRVA